MDPDTGDGGTPGNMGATGRPVTPTRKVAEGAEGDTGQAPKTVDAATTRDASTRTPKVTNETGTPRHADKRSAVPVSTKEQQEGIRTKAVAREDAKIA